MKRSLVPAATALALVIALLAPLSLIAQPSSPVTAMSSPTPTTTISGPFDVKMIPQSAADATVARMRLDKRYHGALEATGDGEMLAAMTGTKGSAGYTAIEKVTGKLAGREGTFLLQHSGIMSRGEKNLTITVVPDSGTGQLTGLSGTMDIQIAADGSHTYVFSYRLPAE